MMLKLPIEKKIIHILANRNPMEFKILLLTSVLLLLVGTATAATYYISPTGNDANNGLSSATPKLSMNLASSLNAGDTLYLMHGTHTVGEMTLSASGSPGSPITITGDSDAIINCHGQDGLDISWVPITDVIISNITFFNGKAGVSVECNGRYYPVSRVDIQNVTFHNLDYGVYGIETGSDTGDLSKINVTNCTMCNLNLAGVNICGGHFCRITNNYIYDIHSTGDSYGIGYDMDDSFIANNIVAKCEYDGVQGHNFYGISVFTNALNDTIYNNKIHDYMGRGIRADANCVNLNVSNNTVYNGDFGLDIYENGISTIKYNTFQNLSSWWLLTPVSSTIQGNNFIDCENSWYLIGGTYGEPGRNVIVKENTFKNTMLLFNDQYDMLIENNIFRDFTSKVNPAVEMSQGGGSTCKNITVKNNVFYNDDTGVYLGYDTITDSSVRNNIFLNVGTAVSNSGGHASNTNIKYNTIYNNAGTGIVNIANSNTVYANPLFQDLTSFKLSTGSPCIDAGDPADAYSLEPQPNGGRIDQGIWGNRGTGNITQQINPALIYPTANFTSNVTNGAVPLSLQFTDCSENATSWNWNFGDGANSTQQSPVHTFSSAGNYIVNLTVSNANGTSSKTAVINVSAPIQPVLPVANFSSNITEGNAPLCLQVTDLSENEVARNWDFGDGTNSTEQNPVHTYSSAGIYTINLAVSNANGTNSKSAAITVLNPTAEVLPVANFSANPRYGTTPLQVQFTDKSTGSPTSWTWDFGDGTAISTEKNPVHTYTNRRRFSVTLIVNNTAGSNSIKKWGYISSRS